MDMHELIRQMERSERIWPDDRPWSIQVLASCLHIQSAELLSLFRQINPALETERDQVLPEDLRLLKAYCELSRTNSRRKKKRTSKSSEEYSKLNA